MSFHWRRAERYGLVKDDGIVDLTTRIPGIYSIRGLLAAGGVRKAVAFASAPTDVKLADVVALPVIPDVGKVLAVGRNYADHLAEGKREPPPYPMLFPRYPESLVGHGATIVKPRVSDKLDYEGELAVIIGRGGRHIAQSDALSHVAGYTCLNDGSVRDWQRHTAQLLPGKNFTASGSVGPWMVTADEIPDPSKLTLVTRVNGMEVQRTSTGDMIFSIPFLIEYISTFIDLNPGDVLATGTPAGVGLYRDPQLWLKAGDVLEVEISGIGVLRNPVVDEPPA